MRRPSRRTIYVVGPGLRRSAWLSRLVVVAWLRERLPLPQNLLDISYVTVFLSTCLSILPVAVVLARQPLRSLHTLPYSVALHRVTGGRRVQCQAVNAAHASGDASLQYKGSSS